VSPLRWHRGTFSALRSEDGTTCALRPVSGPVAGAFGIYKGHVNVRLTSPAFTLAHVHTGRSLATLPLQRACKKLAEDLAPLRMHWEQTDPDRVAGADAERIRFIVRDHEEASRPQHLIGWSGVGGRL